MKSVMDLSRFVEAQEQGSCGYQQALAEVRSGHKRGHWIWYVFPQMKGLGHSMNSEYYGIESLEEAKAYLAHPLLSQRLKVITQAFLSLEGATADSVFGGLDGMKVKSCMTLFDLAQPHDIFEEVLEKYYAGERCWRTLAYCGKEGADTRILLGAIAGDVIGSVYEFWPTHSTDFELFQTSSHYTDDTVMTVANADWLLTGDSLLGVMQDYGNRYAGAGYGGMFCQWLFYMDDPQPYNSWGNGSAMRVSPVGWAFDTLEETLEAAKQSAEVTHNHPEGIKGAQATAASIFLARTGKSKQEIKDYVEQTFGYDLSRTCDEIRPNYTFKESCQETVPESIIAFLESTDYESAIRLAVSLGGDADTMGAITGGIAEAFYGGVPAGIKAEVVKRLPDEFIGIMIQFYQKFVAGRICFTE